MSETQLRYWTALWAIEGIGWITFQRLLKLQTQRQLSWPKLWSDLSKRPVPWGLSEAQAEAVKNFQQRYTPANYSQLLAEKKITVLSREAQEYPSLLQEIFDPPPILFVKGDLKLFQQPLLAIVGTRHMTSYGKLVTTKLTREVVHSGLGIVSGFMYGVDTLAHQITHQNGGKTIGVLGYGFDHMFPRSHQSLFDHLLEQGQTFVTEYAPHVAPKPGLFPRRNRLIAGMAVGVLVTEAAAQSGSHITAEYAAEYGRSIYAVPGPITNPFCDGTKALINMGALCVSSGEEIIRDLGREVLSSSSSQSLTSDSEGRTQLQPIILKALASTSQSVSQLADDLQLPISKLLSELTFLELNGQISRDGEIWSVTQ